jgi:hypothetical protein
MGGKRKVAVHMPGAHIVHGPAREEGVERNGQTEMVLSTMVGGVIGRRVMLHTLLGPADFACLCSGKGFSQPSPQHWAVGGAPFQVSFLSHCLLSEFQYLTIISEGCMSIAGGRKAKFRMELSLERISVSLMSAAMQRVGAGEPLVLNFDSGTASLAEAAFSFDIDQKGDTHGCMASGCGFLAISPRM